MRTFFLSLPQRMTVWTFIVALVWFPLLSHGQANGQANGQGSQPPAFTDQQLDQMLAPIALYPDSLLAQIFMASTYPSQVAEAAKWSKANPKQQGDAAVKAVESQSWDPAVKSLVAFPQVMQMMGDKPDWVQNVGDAFLANSNRVMDRVQFMRHKAKDSGNLKTTEQQKVIVEPAPAPAPSMQTEPTSQTVIKIEPAQPNVVYVPSYNPTVVYGSWWYPSYPPVYFPPPPGYVFGTAMAFGFGIAAAGAIWGNCNWGGGDVNIDVDRYNNINKNNKIDASKRNQTWNHNPQNRGGTPYRDQGSQQRFGKSTPGADQRSQFRGRDNQRAQAERSMQQRGMDPARQRQELSGSRDKVQQQVDRANRSPSSSFGQDNRGLGGSSGGDRNFGGQSRDNAFSGAGNGTRSQHEMNRGQSSRQSMDRSGGSRGGGSSFGGSSRGGGGFGGAGGGRAGGGARGGGRR